MIKSYIITLIGIAVLSIIIDVVLPNGKIQNFVKAMFNLIILSAITLPIITIINTKINIDNLFNYEINVDYDFIEASNKKIYSNLEQTIKTDLNNIGYSNVGITIEFKTNKTNTIIEKIKIDISKIKININVPHNDIKIDILEVVYKYINIESSNIVFIE